MKREYDKTLDLSRGQGTGMQRFERENGKRPGNMISLRRAYLQLSSSRNFSRLWPSCPCHRLQAPVRAGELEGAAPATACIKHASNTLIKHKRFGHILMESQAVTSGALDVLLPACTGMSLLLSPPSLSLHKPLWCIFHTAFEVWNS